jgi:hypothetical protein
MKKYQVTRQITTPTGDLLIGQEVELEEEDAKVLFDAGAIAPIETKETKRSKVSETPQT